MDHTERASDPAGTISANVKRLRARKGWTAKELGERLTAAGVAWDRSIVANLENGRRPNVSVVELLALAMVLDVAPVHLLVPVDGPDHAPYQVTPERMATVGEVRAWVRGMSELPETEGRTFWTEVPQHEFGKNPMDEPTPDRQEYERVLIRWLLRQVGRVYRRADGARVFEWQMSAGKDTTDG